MLPTFQKIVNFRSRQNLRFIEGQADELSPVGLVDRHVQFEGRRSQMIRYDGTIDDTGMAAIQAEITLTRMPLDEFSNGVVVGKLVEIARQVASGQSRHFFETLDRVTNETGNVFDAGGRNMDEDLFLQMLDSMPLVFDDHGNWEPPVVLTGSKGFPSFTDNPPTLEFNRRLAKIVARKKLEHRSREADRVLAG